VALRDLPRCVQECRYVTGAIKPFPGNLGSNQPTGFALAADGARLDAVTRRIEHLCNLDIRIKRFDREII
jgi:hypothetical protein